MRALAAAMLPLVPLLFALGRPVSIDDPLFLKAAAQIRVDPSRPYDAVTYWYETPGPLWEIAKNPPGISYWLALVQALGGQSEVAWHLAMLPFTVTAVGAGVWLARRFVGESGWSTAIWVASPAFLVSASTLMPDVPSLALSLAGTALYISGVDRDRRVARLVGALVVGGAIVMKYPALVGVPVLALYPCFRAGRSLRYRALADLAAVAIPLAAWSLQNVVTHGSLHIIDSLTTLGERTSAGFVQQLVALAAFLPAASIFPALFVVVAWRRRARGVALIASALGGVGAGLLAPALWPEAPRSLGLAVAVSAAIGVCALLTAAWAAARAWRDDPDTLFLAAWAGAYLLFVLLISWTVAARFLLPAVPPLAWVLCRSLGMRPGQGQSRATRWLAATGIVTLALSIAVMRADSLPAEFHRDVIARVAERARQEHRRVLFRGAWSVLYYAERAGMQWFDAAREPARSGDLLLGAQYVSNTRVPPELIGRLSKVGEFSSPVPPLGLHTMNQFVGAGFYSTVWGPLPFALRREPAAVVFVYRVD
jgi:hypothetical protein